MMATRIVAFDINPLNWLGSAASKIVGDVWKAAMTALWSAAIWALRLAFQIIDAFTQPDLSADGPMRQVLPITLWIGGSLAVIMLFVQLTLALVRRDGQSLGRVLIGIGQFWLVWVGYLGVAAGLVLAAAGLERGILQAMLHANGLAGVNLDASFPDKVDDVTLATVLGVLSLLVVIPAAFFYVLIMFVREAALIILVATAPISAGGLISEVGKTWFWKTLRWFFACLLISPTAALLLGIGVKVSNGVINPPAGSSDKSVAAHAGMAVVGCIVIAIGAVCPLILFRLLAFVEPGTASGAALRQSWADAGGVAGLLSGGSKRLTGSAAATQTGADGRSSGESGAESQTQSRLATATSGGGLGQALGTAGHLFGKGMQVATSIGFGAADIGSDVLGQAGVGSPGYSMTPADERMSRRSSRSPATSAPGGPPADGGNGASPTSGGGPSGDAGGSTGGGPPQPPLPQSPVGPSEPPSPSGGAASGGGAAAGSGEVPVPAVIP
jgi:type IV secretion system protein TrbL